MRKHVVETQEIFRFERTGEAFVRADGEFRLTGYVPTFGEPLGLGEGYFER